MSSTSPTRSSRMTPPARSTTHSAFYNPLLSAELKLERLLLGTICFDYEYESELKKTSENLEIAARTRLTGDHFSSGTMGNIFRAMIGLWANKQDVNPATLARELAGHWPDGSTLHDFIATCIWEAWVNGAHGDEVLFGLIRKVIDKDHYRSLILLTQTLRSMVEGEITGPKDLATMFTRACEEYKSELFSEEKILRTVARQVERMRSVKK